MIGFKIDLKECSECLRCMIACSLAKTGVVKLKDSRIRIIKGWPEEPVIHVCRFDDCRDKPCIEACPVEAITIEQDIVKIDRDTCTGCLACIDVCPYSAIQMDDEELAVKCDFCGGDPACVKECVTGALERKEA